MPLMVMPLLRIARRPLLAIFFILVIAACGGEDDTADPTATRTTTDSPSVMTATPTPVADSTSGNASPAAATPVVGSASPVTEPIRQDAATLAPNEVTLGVVADRIAASWPQVQTYREEVVTVTSAGTPVPGAPTATREVAMPERKRFVVALDGTTIEVLFVNSTLFRRVGDAPWTTVDVSAVTTSDPFYDIYEQMQRPVTPPYAGLSARQRERIGEVGDLVTIDGRQCQSFIFLQVTESGERLDTTVTLDETGLPCTIETAVGGSITRSTFTYNVAVTIEPPAGVIASPIASPVATPAASPEP